MPSIFVKGHEILFSAEDAGVVMASSWSISHGYAVGWCKIQKKVIALHRILMGPPPAKGLTVDHINRNRLDNRRENLRWATPLENCGNSGPRTSKYKGVRSQSKSSFYTVLAYEYLGTYSTEYEAALAYDKSARERYGDSAYLNFPEITDYSWLERLPPVTTMPRSSTVRGVSYSHTRKAREKWRATYKGKHLGWFKREEDAINCRLEAENEG